MVRVYGALLIGGALVVVPMGMGGILLLKLLLFALAALIGALTIALRHPALAGAMNSEAASRKRSSRMVQSFLFMFFAVVFLSPLWSAAPILSIVGVEPRFEGMMAYVVFLGLAIGAWGMVRAGREQSLLHAVLWSNVGVVAYGLLQVARMDPLGGWWDAEAFLGRVFSTVGQPNMLGQFLVLTAPLAPLAAGRWWGTNSLSQWPARLTRSDGERVTRPNVPVRYGRGVRGFPIIAGVVLVLNLIVLLATGSRAAMLGAVVGGGIFLLGHCVTLRKISLSMTRLGIFLFVTVIVAFPLAFRRFSLHDEWDRSLRSRTAIWRDAVSMIRARPMGWGLETTGLIFPRFQRAPLTAYESLTVSVDRAHSKPLDLLLTVGPLGLLSYYAFLLLLFLRCFQVWRSRRDPLILAGMASLAGVSVSLLFGFEGVVTHAFFWLVCGMLAGLPLPAPARRSIGEGGGEGRGEGLPTQSFRRTFFFFSIVLLAIIFFILLSLSARVTANRAEQAFQAGDLVAATRLYGSATRRVPWDRALLVRFIETALLARERAADHVTQEAIDAVLAKRLHHLEWLTSGSDPLSPSLRAWHAALRGEREEAMAFLNDAKVLAPFSIPRLRIAGKVAELLGDAAMGEAIRAELTRMLPPWWNDANDPRHRILWKENPWLEEFMPSSQQMGKDRGQSPSPRGRGSG